MFDEPVIIIVGLAVSLLAGVTQGLTGFGYSLVFVSLMISFLPPRVVIPVVTVHSALINLIILYGVREWVRAKRTWPLAAAGIAAMPLGAYLLTALDADVLKLFTGLIIVLFACAFLAGFERKISNEGVASIFVGAMSGLLNSSTGMSGPPVILFFANQGVKKDVFRANLTAYFFALNAATLAYFAITGIMTREALEYALLFVPGLLLGAVVGIRLAGRVNEILFRKIALVVVIAAGLACAAPRLIALVR